jgi:biotin carboxyl carrier protein
MKKLRVTIEGKVYEVLVETIDDHGKSSLPATTSPSSMPVASAAAAPVSAPAAARPAASGAGDVPSPLAGKVVSIDVKVGQTVAEGAQVATIEAMKMNTYIFASKAGTVAEILASAGEGVEEGTVLLRIA